MQEAYLEAIRKIRKLKEIVTEKEWNAIAQKDSLLSSVSLEYISKKKFIELQKELRAS